jgi:hypothetical protein
MPQPFKFVLICGAWMCASGLVASENALIRPGDTWGYFIGEGEPAPGWNQPEFKDAGWLRGASGFSRGFLSYDEATLLPEPAASYVSVYFRKSFVVTNLADIVWPTLRIDYDDGVVAFLNGHLSIRNGFEWTERAHLVSRPFGIGGSSRDTPQLCR